MTDWTEPLKSQLVFLFCVCAFNKHSEYNNSLSLMNRKEEKRTSPGTLWIYDSDGETP